MSVRSYVCVFILSLIKIMSIVFYIFFVAFLYTEHIIIYYDIVFITEYKFNKMRYNVSLTITICALEKMQTGV